MFCKKGSQVYFFILYYLLAMIKIFSKAYKIRLVGLFHSREYFHEIAHYIDLIIEVTITVFVKVTNCLSRLRKTL